LPISGAPEQKCHLKNNCQ